MKETEGKVIRDHLLENYNTDDQVTAEEFAKDATFAENYMKFLWKAIAKGKKAYSKDRFFIDIRLKEERIFKGKKVFKYTSVVKQNCPSPTIEHDVYMYDRSKDEIEYLWTIPTERRCKYLLDNALNLSAEEKEALSFVLDHKDGTLLLKAMKLNGEIK